MEQISRSQLRLLRGLTHRSVRDRRDRVLVEGFRAVEAALESGRVRQLLALSEAAAGHEMARALIEAAESRSVPVRVISEDDLAGISDVVTSQGVLAVAHWAPQRDISAPHLREVLEAAQGRGVLILDGVSDPGNAGTLARTARSFGLAGFVLSRGSVEATHPKLLRASSGALFSLEVVADDVALPPLLEALRGAGWEILVADATGGRNIDDLTPAGPWALVLGNEAHGPSEPVLRLGRPVHLPMHPGAESLNVAVAGGILLYLLRERATAEGLDASP
jgi:TrmH family RNA methyltransferase